MEKRALAAVILSMLVLLIWGYFEQKNVQQRKAVQERLETETKKSKVRELPPVQEKSTVATGEPVDIKSLTARPSYIDGEPEPVKDIVVENETAIITLTSLGARLKGYRLKKYKDKSGNKLEMLPERDYEDLPLALDFKQEAGNLVTADGTQLDAGLFTSRVNRAVYRVDRDRLLLSNGYPSGKLRMSYHDASGVKVIKEFTFYADKYGFDVNVRIEGLSRYPQGVPYQIMWGPAINEEKQRKGRQLGLQVITFDGRKTHKQKSRKLAADQVETEPVQWVSMGTKYFVAAMVPTRAAAPAILRRVAQRKIAIGMRLRTNEGGGAEPQLVLYVGPKEAKRLQAYGSSLERVIDYRWTPFGDTVTRALAKPLLAILFWFYSFTHNYGIAIILLTLVIKAAFYPLTEKSFLAMQRMQVLQPKMKILQERYKHDKQRLNQEMMQLYRTHKANPMGGCLPMLAQLPIFYALYVVLMYSIELRQAPFIWWIKDLSDYDPYFVTPILMGVTMFFQQKMSPTMGDPRQAKMMLMMPVIFTVMFIYFPVGLVIYWMVSNLLTIVQQYFIKKKVATAQAKK